MTLLAPDLHITGMQLAAELRHGGFSSQLITPLDGRYEGARHVWNGGIDRRPALIAQCATAHDVALVVATARDRGLPLAVRGGGHSMVGHGVCDDGIVADLSPMRGVDLDPRARTMRAGGGALLEDLARAGQPFGLAVPSGHVSHTGIGGITTGGGMGWYHRQLGLTIDSLTSAQVVTADGEVVEASVEVNDDLFWAIRGGGGNFGVVTEFRFAAHPLGPTVFAGMMLFEIERAPEAIQTSRALLEDDPDLMLWEILAICPPDPGFPSELHGKPVCLVCVTSTADIGAARQATEPLRRLGPALDLTGPMPYSAVQFMVDASSPPGLECYGRSHWMAEFGEPAIEAMIDAIHQCTSPLSAIICGRMGGAVADVPADATAFGYRDAHSVVWVVNPWAGGDPAEHRAWVRATSDAAAPWASGGVYVNALDQGEEDRVRAAYPAATWDRLVAAKDRWDPDNVFRLNANVPPSR
jgi:FAD/FMN-containing dehydrogenase